MYKGPKLFLKKVSSITKREARWHIGMSSVSGSEGVLVAQWINYNINNKKKTKIYWIINCCDLFRDLEGSLSLLLFEMTKYTFSWKQFSDIKVLRRYNFF